MIRLRRQRWLSLVPRRELNVLHHSLRLVAQHPAIEGPEREEIEALADELWTESCRRSDGRRASRND